MDLRYFLRVIAFSCAGLIAAQNLPVVPGSSVVDVTEHDGYFNEPSIAIDPHNSEKLVAAYQVNSTAAYSEDGGRTWKVVDNVAIEGYRKSGDVSVTYDPRGHAILCSIAFDKHGPGEHLVHNARR